jgi:transposase
MYQVHLTDEQRTELNRRAHDKSIAPSTRDRLEMLRLSDADWHVPQIARHLDQHEYTVRRWIKTFLSGGFEALVNKPHLGRASALTQEILEAVRQEVAKGERTWTAQQLADWTFEHHGVRISHHRMRIQLARCGLSYQRNSYSVDHKQKPEEVEAKKASLETLEKGGTRA